MFDINITNNMATTILNQYFPSVISDLIFNYTLKTKYKAVYKLAFDEHLFIDEKHYFYIIDSYGITKTKDFEKKNKK